VRLVIGRRLEHVSDEVRHVLTGAAVIGRSFSFQLLEALEETEPDALLDAVDESERANLIAAADDGPEARFTFAHELIRQTLISGLSLPRRQRTHLRIAEAMERVYARNLEEHSADLAHHLYQAGAAADPDKTVRFLSLAGDRALAAAAFEDALRLFDEAVPLLAPDVSPGRADLLYKRGRALRSLGRWDDAVAVWQAAIDAYEDLRDAEGGANLAFDMTWLLGWSGHIQEAIEVGRRGLAFLDEAPSAQRCRLLGALGTVTSLFGDFAAGRQPITQALDMAEALGDHHLLGTIFANKANHHWSYFQSVEQAEAGLRAVDLLRSAGDLWQLSEAQWLAAGALTFLGRFDDAARICDDLEPLADRLGNLGAILCAHRWRGITKFVRTPELDKSEVFLERDREICESADMPWISHSYTWRGLFDFWRGTWRDAKSSFQTAVECEAPGVWAGADWAHLFLHTAYLGETKAALAMLQDKVDMLPRPDQANTVGAWTMLYAVVEGLAILGERAEVAKLYPLVLQQIADGPVVRIFGYGLIQTVAGIAAAAAEEWDKAEDHFQTALRQADELPFVIAQSETHRWYARMLIDRNGPGDRDKAHDLLADAITTYRDIGMPKHMEMAEALLSEAGPAA
jgi:tetratricopeptide (TPR) repeat protein